MLTTVREGKKAPPTCPECKCRLNVFHWGEQATFAHHFISEEPEKDAQGHLCSQIGNVWSIESKQK